MRSTNAVCALAVIFAAAPAAFAGDIFVPRDEPTLQEALAAAQPGDRIVVTSTKVRTGPPQEILVDKSDLTLVGRGATVIGKIRITGDRVTVRGFRFIRDQFLNAGVGTEGADTTIERNRFKHGEAWAVAGSRPRFERNRFSGDEGGIFVRSADAAVVRKNRLSSGEIRIGDGYAGYAKPSGALVEGNVGPRTGLNTYGAGHVVRGNTLDSMRVNDCPQGVVEQNVCRGISDWLSMRTYGAGVQVRDNVATSGLSVKGDGAVVTGNVIGTTADFSQMGLKVQGDDAVVSSNTITNATFGVAVWGARPTIESNSASVGSTAPMFDAKGDFQGCPGIWVQSDVAGGTIANNTITHTYGIGITVLTDGVTVTGNEVHGVGADTSIHVVADGVVVESNTIVHTKPGSGTGEGVSLAGDANVVRGNDVTNVPEDAIAVLSGAGNTLTDNVLGGAKGCGIYVAAEAPGTAIADCTVTDCPLGIVNRNAGTAVTGSRLEDNKWADVLDLAGFRLFDANAFGTLSHDTWLAPVR